MLRIPKKTLKKITKPDGSLDVSSSGDGLGVVCDFLRTAERHKDRFGYYVITKDGKQIAHIIGICTDSSRGSDYRILVRIWPEDESDMVAYYCAAGGGGYDFEAASMRGIVFAGQKLGDHCDPEGNPALRDLCNQRGYRRLSF
jgi:hypothetical protein